MLNFVYFLQDVSHIFKVFLGSHHEVWLQSLCANGATQEHPGRIRQGGGAGVRDKSWARLA